MEWIIGSIALLMAYLFARVTAASFKRSRCHRAKVRYSVRRGTDTCVRCGMAQD